jgi:hypothetical protein
MIDFLLLSNCEPYRLGIYENNNLIDSFEVWQKAGNAFAILIQMALQKYNKPKRMLYATGPGNLTSIKLGYITAKTVAISFDIEFLGASSFNFNGFLPLAAFGAKSFVFKDDLIVLSDEKAVDVSLPSSIANIKFLANQTPVYPLPCVM